MVIPIFFRNQNIPQNPRVMLSFEIKNNKNITEWCTELSLLLNENNITATIFFPGKLVEQNPTILNIFEKGIDIGSQTYNYVNISSLDFTTQLNEIKKGKQIIDQKGNLNSQIFKAPYGETDENIFYLLTQNNITADFSYQTQFNLYENGQFIKYEAITSENTIASIKTSLNILENHQLLIIPFENTDLIQDITEIILELKKFGIQFVNASDLAGTDLTGRGE